MNEQQSYTVDVLNQLYEAEMHSVLPRLCDLQISASNRTAGLADLLRRLCEHSNEHREWLIEAIDAEGGAVWPVALDPSTAMLHYLSAAALLPLIVRDLRKLLSRYDAAARERVLSPGAADAIGRISRRYTAVLERLESLNSTASAAPSTRAD